MFSFSVLTSVWRIRITLMRQITLKRIPIRLLIRKYGSCSIFHFVEDPDPRQSDANLQLRPTDPPWLQGERSPGFICEPPRLQAESPWVHLWASTLYSPAFSLRCGSVFVRYPSFTSRRIRIPLFLFHADPDPETADTWIRIPNTGCMYNRHGTVYIMQICMFIPDPLLYFSILYPGPWDFRPGSWIRIRNTESTKKYFYLKNCL